MEPTNEQAAKGQGLTPGLNREAEEIQSSELNPQNFLE
jgi:hypothetical protein